MPIHVEVIELVPHPDGIEIFVQVHDRISDHIESAGKPGQICKCPDAVGDDQDMSVGEHSEIVGEDLHGDVKVRSGEPCVEVGHGELANCVARQVELSQEIWSRRGNGDREGRLRSGRDEAHEMPIGERDDRIEGDVGHLTLWRIVEPDDIAIEIGRVDERLFRRWDDVDHFHARLGCCSGCGAHREVGNDAGGHGSRGEDMIVIHCRGPILIIEVGAHVVSGIRLHAGHQHCCRADRGVHRGSGSSVTGVLSELDGDISSECRMHHVLGNQGVGSRRDAGGIAAAACEQRHQDARDKGGEMGFIQGGSSAKGRSSRIHRERAG